MDTVAGHTFNALFSQKFGRQRLRRGAGTIQSGEFSGFRVPINYEEIAAETRHQRLGHTQHGVGGNGGIHCRPAFAQNLRPRL